MKQMRYRGSNRREVSSEDFSSVGVKSKDVTASNGDVVEMSDAAATWFLENEADNWEELSESEAAQASAQDEDE